jgi:plasmid stabilization system protein ParE
MPPRLEFRPFAIRDLDRIVEYIARQNRDYVVARRFAHRLMDRCEGLLRAPGSGALAGIEPNVRKIVEGAYKIYYRREADKIVILRIWDGRRGTNPRI